MIVCGWPVSAPAKLFCLPKACETPAAPAGVFLNGLRMGGWLCCTFVELDSVIWRTIWRSGLKLSVGSGLDKRVCPPSHTSSLRALISCLPGKNKFVPVIIAVALLLVLWLRGVACPAGRSRALWVSSNGRIEATEIDIAYQAGGPY